MVVEDQSLAREHIVSMLEQLNVDVVAACEHGREAVERITAVAPDVVFLDVQMPEMTGFEVIEALGADAMPPVVFITAYDAYTLKAFEVFAAGYPAQRGPAIARVVDRLGHGHREHSSRRARDLAKLLAKAEVRSGADRLVVREGGRVVFVRTGDIEWIEACSNYAVIHAGGQRHFTRQPMLALQRRLARDFARIHRSTLVNLSQVVELRAAAYGEYDVVMRSGKALRVTRRFRAALQERLERLP
jgi:two-component system LytT family response regulator